MYMLKSRIIKMPAVRYGPVLEIRVPAEFEISKKLYLKL